MQKIIIAGGNGFIGSYVVKKFLDDNFEVFILDDDINYFIPLSNSALKNIKWRQANLTKGAKIYKINLNNINELKKIIRDITPSHIINLAALPLAKNAIKDTNDAFSSIIVNAKNFMEILRNEKKETKFTHISSSMIYGDFEKEPNLEEAKKNPKEIYGSFKYASEIIVNAYSKIFNINLNIVRPTAVYGPTDNNQRVVQKFVDSAINNKIIYASSPENNYLDFTYVEDAAEGIKCVALSNAQSGETFNISYGKASSIMDVINELKQHFPSLQFEIKKNETFYPKRGSLDISKALKLTKYLPKTSLTEGIKKYINFVKSNL